MSTRMLQRTDAARAGGLMAQQRPGLRRSAVAVAVFVLAGAACNPEQGCMPTDQSCGPAPAVTATFTAGATPATSLTVGDHFTLFGTLSEVQNGKADSVVIFSGIGRLYGRAGASASISGIAAEPGNPPYVIKGYASRMDGSGATVRKVTVRMSIAGEYGVFIAPPVR